MGLLRKPLGAIYERLGGRYPRVALAVVFSGMQVVALGGVGLLTLYQPLTDKEFWELLIAVQVLTAADSAFHLHMTLRLVRPADPWLRGRRDPDSALAAWRALATLPLSMFKTTGSGWMALLGLVPASLLIVVVVGLPWYALLALLAGAGVVLLYGLIARFLATELTMRPVLEDISADLPDGVDPAVKLVPLRWKLLVAFPAINIVTGVVVAGLSQRGHAHLSDLGLDILAAVAVAFTVSLELTLLLSRSLLQPIQDLRAATRRVAAGDLSTRVPVISNDETGALTGAFNEMMAGLQDRQKLRDAFGTYVDPQLAERVLREGVNLEGEEVEVSILFIDIRGFTAFAERSSAREVVAKLNDFFELVVPVLVNCGGHANKFIGDGLLGVVGAPDRFDDHADRALSVALEVARCVRERFGDELRIGIGVNSGPVVAGTIGGGGHLEFTVIGDPVNTASRVEEITRQTGDEVLITEATRCLLTRDFGAMEPRGTVQLKGKSERVALYAPCAAVQALEDGAFAGADGSGGGAAEVGGRAGPDRLARR
jgi:class 3 adenylate cyclase